MEISDLSSVRLALGLSYPPTQFTLNKLMIHTVNKPSLLVINVIITVLGLFHLQRAQHTLLLAILYPALPQPHKGIAIECGSKEDPA